MECELVAQVGRFARGEKFEAILMKHSQSQIVLQRGGGEYVYSLSYAVGDAVK